MLTNKLKRCRRCNKILNTGMNKSYLCAYHYRRTYKLINKLKMNKNYVKGRRKEYKIVNEEKDKGCVAFRSAGSHSPIDVVSIDYINKTIKLIQAKPNSMSDNAKLKIELTNKELNGLFIVAFSVQ